VVFKAEFPKWESLKNKSGKSGMFFEPKTDRQPSQLSPAIHHNFTAKKPRSTTRFCQNPQQKRSPTTPKKLLQSIPSSGGVLAPSGDGGGSYFVQAVLSEPLSRPDSLLSGTNTGIFHGLCRKYPGTIRQSS
jgi:hypothetical protein